MSSSSILIRLGLLTSAMVFGVGDGRAQSFTSLCSFTNANGAYPWGGVVVSSNRIYGTTYNGGTNGGWGSIFAVNADGSDYTGLYFFSQEADGENSNGANPLANMILAGNTLYGTASQGGTNGDGTVFAVHTDGTGITNLHNFAFSDGYSPQSGLILSGNTLFGTTQQGGSYGSGYGGGTVFRVNTDGTGFATVYTFTRAHGNSLGIGTNSDGRFPVGGLVLSGNMLYGTAGGGGTFGYGTVFGVSIDGTGFTNLHNFAGNDGGGPGGLVFSNSILYGTASGGGPKGSGTVFAVNTDGTGFITLHAFSGADGVGPGGGLILSSNTLYGTTGSGGFYGSGTVFAVDTDATGFAVLHNFNGSDGANPIGGMALSDDTLYGTTEAGGPGSGTGNGTVFAISLSGSFKSGPLTIQLNGQNLVLSWGDPAYSLLSGSTVTGPWERLWGVTSPYSISMTQSVQFFRLVR